MGYQAGVDEDLQELAHKYDALVIAAGTLVPQVPEISGTHLPSVYHGLEFLRLSNEQTPPDIGGTVAVIGGGFTAIDSSVD